MISLEAEIVVIGGGLAGLTAALTVAQEGKTPLLITDPDTASATSLSGGRFRASGPGYPVERHFLDILATGEYLAERPLAKLVAQDAPGGRVFLERHGVVTTDTEEGFAVNSGSTPPGRSLAESLIQAAGRAGVKTIPGMAWDIITSTDGRVAGLLVYDAHKAAWAVIATPQVIIATGGGAGIYRRTTNSRDATGDGLALAFRAGASLADMEFVQFWPLAALGNGHCAALPFARAKGMRLYGRGDEDISQKVGLEGLAAGVLRPSAVARAVYDELRPVWPSDDEDLPLRLVPSTPSDGPTDSEALMVTAAAHHTMGGVVCGDHGQTRVEGLFVAGETIAAVHGADRLTGAGLTEAVVTGRRAAVLAAREGPSGPPPSIDLEREARQRIRALMSQIESGPGNSPSPSRVRDRIAVAMWRNAALRRTRDSLDAAQSELNRIKRALPFGIDASDGGLVRDALKALNTLIIAEAVIRSARYRRESRGAHFRADFVEQDPTEWSRHVRVKLFAGEMSLEISQGLGLMEP